MITNRIINKQEAYRLLIDLNKQGLDISNQIADISKNTYVPETVLHFINKNRPLDITNFYNKLRKDNNKGKSKLYINIMKDLEDINEILITLSSLITQIFIYGKTLEGSNRNMFFSNVKVLLIQEVINEYIINGNSEGCIVLLKQLKSDIKVLEQDKN